MGERVEDDALFNKNEKTKNKSEGVEEAGQGSDKKATVKLKQHSSTELTSTRASSGAQDQRTSNFVALLVKQKIK